METAGNVAGAVGAAMIANKIVPMIIKPGKDDQGKDKEPDTKITNMIVFGAGVMLPHLAGGGKPKKTMIDHVGTGMRTVAALGLVEEFFPDLLNGVGMHGVGLGAVAPADALYGADDYDDDPLMLEGFDESIAAPDNGYYNAGATYGSSVAGVDDPVEEFASAAV